MARWTKEDEQQLARLLERKGQAEFESKRKLAGVVRQFHVRDISVEDLAEAMPVWADDLVEALKPFCSASGPVVVPQAVAKFLRGEGELEGVAFGDKPASAQGVFFWRRYL